MTINSQTTCIESSVSPITSSVPVYDGSISVYEYLEKVKEFEKNLRKQKYDKILIFINELIMSQWTSLSEIPQISRDKLLENKFYNKKIMNEYYNKLSEVFGVTPYEMIIICDNYYNDPDQFINFLEKVLNTINYSMIQKNVKNDDIDQMFYVIRPKREKDPDSRLNFCHYKQRKYYSR
ncbi:MAG: hypothetical protein Terrestrivirus7_29 [Terrestrivirus sp.]|uniref:Uncharacterized protein n=1 Tax=Terrestrivirus sp. TaxID=2487775 RepID=A0A3G4ZNM0_9VIRU|nr:MAG: hypothetical protein Terrestrivirus7_29 [Terrestrivirus sp.]